MTETEDEVNSRIGHNQPCYYCGDPTDVFAGNPGLWPLPFPHADEPGVVKWHHTDCVMARLVENVETAITGLEANFLLFTMDAYLGVDQEGHIMSAKHGYPKEDLQALRDKLFVAHRHPPEDEEED